MKQLLLLIFSAVLLSTTGMAQCNAAFSDTLATWTSNPYDVHFVNASSGYTAVSTEFFWTFSGGTPSTSTVNDSITVSFPGPGTYQVCLDLLDSFAICSDSICQSITLPNAGMTGSLSATNTSCGSCNGAITANVAGGATPYTYLWSNATTGQTASGLCPGSYTVTVTDFNGDTIQLSSSIATSNALDVDISSNDSTPCVGDNVTLTANVTGGTGTYSWSNGSTSSSITTNTSGTYVVTVTTSQGCVAMDTFDLTFSPTPALSLQASNETCYQCCDGSASAGASGGSGNYSYLWSNASTSASQSNLCPGSYGVTVQDLVSGCEAYGTAIVSAFTCDTIAGWISQGEDTRVYLIEESGGVLSAVDSTQTDSLGWYQFLGVCTSGTYYVKAALLPNHSLYSSYVPTYFDSAALWGAATGLVVNNNSYHNISFSLLGGNNPGGPGFVGGLVSQGANRGEGDPVPNAQLVLLDENDDVVAFTKTDANGEYLIEGLELGTYRLEVDLLNKVSYPLHFTLDENELTVPNGNFLVNSKSVRPEVPTGMKVDPSSSFEVFPNPTHGIVQLRGEGTILSVTVRSIIGQVVMTQNDAHSDMLELDISQLNAGQYILEIEMDGRVEHQVIVKE